MRSYGKDKISPHNKYPNTFRVADGFIGAKLKYEDPEYTMKNCRKIGQQLEKENLKLAISQKKNSALAKIMPGLSESVDV